MAHTDYGSGEPSVTPTDYGSSGPFITCTDYGSGRPCRIMFISFKKSENYHGHPANIFVFLGNILQEHLIPVQ